MKIKPRISVLIPAYNEEKYIRRTIESVLAQDYPKENYELIVVNNGSTDGTRKVAQKYGAKVVDYTQIQGLSATRRFGASVVTGDITCWLDADVVIPNQWFTTAVAILDKDDVVGVTGPIRALNGSRFQKLIVAIAFEFYRLVNVLYREVYFANGNFAYKTDAYMKTSGFDMNLPSGEDLDISLKLLKVGKIVYDRRLSAKTDTRRLKEGALTSFWRYTVGFLGIKYGWFKVPGYQNYR